MHNFSLDVRVSQLDPDSVLPKNRIRSDYSEHPDPDHQVAKKIHLKYVGIKLFFQHFYTTAGISLKKFIGQFVSTNIERNNSGL